MNKNNKYVEGCQQIDQKSSLNKNKENEQEHLSLLNTSLANNLISCPVSSQMHLTNQLDSQEKQNDDDFVNYVLKDQSQPNQQQPNQDNQLLLNQKYQEQQNYNGDMTQNQQIQNQQRKKKQKSNSIYSSDKISQNSQSQKNIILNHNNINHQYLTTTYNFKAQSIHDKQQNRFINNNKYSLSIYNSQSQKNNFDFYTQNVKQNKLKNIIKTSKKNTTSTTNLKAYNEEGSTQTDFLPSLSSFLPYIKSDQQNDNSIQCNQTVSDKNSLDTNHKLLSPNNKQSLSQKNISLDQTEYKNKEGNTFTPKYHNQSNQREFQCYKGFSYYNKKTQINVPSLKSSFNSQIISSPKNNLQYDQQFIDLDLSGKNKRSQSLNLQKYYSKGQQTSLLENQNRVKESTSKQDLLINQYNIADSNIYLLSQIHKVVIIPPPQFCKSDSIFIPKVMTRNASFLKKGLNTTQNIITPHAQQKKFIFQYDAKKNIYHENYQYENTLKANLQNSFKTNDDVLQLEFINNNSNNNNLSNSIVSQSQINNDYTQKQQLNKTSNLKSYICYQNKFLGQKQHEFLMNNFKKSQQINNQKVTKQENNQLSDLLIHDQSGDKFQQYQSFNNTEKMILSKKIEESEQQLQELKTKINFNSKKQRQPICSFKNQNSKNLYNNQIQKVIHDSEDESKDISEQLEEKSKQQPNDSQQQDVKLEYKNLKKYYDEKYEQKIISQNNANQTNNCKKDKNKSNNYQQYCSNCKVNNIIKEDTHKNINENQPDNFQENIDFLPWNYE